MTALDDAFRPWLDCLLRSTGALALYDAHTHIGQNDPDGFKQTPDELVAGLAAADARGVVFPMHEPGGYREANDTAIAAAAAHPDRLVAFCRLDPRDGAIQEAARCLDAGARGIKLHPRAERFGMDEPVVEDIVALAGERGVPILIHAGPRDPGAGAAHGRAGRGPPRRDAHPRPRGHLRPRLALARAARPPERADRHARGGIPPTSWPCSPSRRRRASCGRATRRTGAR